MTAAAVTPRLHRRAVDHDQVSMLPQAGQLLVQHTGGGELRAVRGSRLWPDQTISVTEAWGSGVDQKHGGVACGRYAHTVVTR